MKAVFSFLFAFLFVIPAHGEPVEDAWNAYLIGDFTKVEKIVSSSLKATDLPDSNRSMLYFTLGCSDAMQGRDVSAIYAFEQAFYIDPALSMKSSDLPPPVWELFNPIQERVAAERASGMIITDQLIRDEIVHEPDTLRIYLPVLRDRNTILKSFGFPGWGHLTEGRKAGLVYGSIETIAVIGFVYSMVKTRAERDDYMGETNVDRIQSEYDDYNLYYNLSWGFGLATVVIYIATQIDFFSGMPPTSLSFESTLPGSSMLQLSIKL